MTYTVIVCKNGKDLVFKDVRKFWIDKLSILMDVDGHSVNIRDYEGLIIKQT